jgi:dipeptidyl-peptidase III
MNTKRFLTGALVAVSLLANTGCGSKTPGTTDGGGNADSNFIWQTEQFADLKIVRYQIPGFDQLTPKQKELAYYLYEAALSGRDIIWDQNGRYNLLVRHTLENIVNTYKGEKSGADWDKFMEYTKRVWFSNGIYHHYSVYKFKPEFSWEYFEKLVGNSDKAKFKSPDGMEWDATMALLKQVMFDPAFMPKRVNKEKGVDQIANSAGNFYEGVTQKEVEAFYAKMENKSDTTPPWYGLNSKVVKVNGKLEERVWKVGGMYDASISKIVYWLEKASGVAENAQQKKTLDLLIEYYKTGDLRKFDEYNLAWIADTNSVWDVVNGFIEVYGDPTGKKGSYESVVSIKDFEATKRIHAISSQAQWFEDHSSIMDEHKKEKVTGITAKVITVVVESGDAAPSTPIGINLPNADWIREVGSKSVNLGNIVHAYDQAAKASGMLDEFCFSKEEADLTRKWGSLAGNLHTDMHEVIGHASGKINPGVGSPKESLKSYASTLEEARADLVALYYLQDQKLIDIGVMTTLDVGKVEYNDYIRNGMMVQLRRLGPDETTIEEDHMRNRQLVAQWCYEKGKAENVIERKHRDGKTFFVVNDYAKLRVLFGDLLREIQRIKSEGDYNAAEALVENYGVKVDPILHKEVLERVEKLKIAPYGGFIQARLVPVMEGNKITDVKVEYPDDFTRQMLELGEKYGFLPVMN